MLLNFNQLSDMIRLDRKQCNLVLILSKKAGMTDNK